MKLWIELNLFILPMIEFNCLDEKKLKVDEFLPIFSQVKKDKDVGNIDDFLECLKLYDKAGDGKMMVAELSHILQSLGKETFHSFTTV